MAGIIHTTVPMRVTRRRLLSGTIGVFVGVAGGRIALAQDGTPVDNDIAIPAGGPERLSGLLRMVPASFGETASQHGVLFYYADVLRQLEATGVSPYQPGSDDLPERYLDATGVLALAAQSFQYALAPEFVDTFGFSPLQAEESLVVGTPPNDLTMFRGGLDLDALVPAWQASGYARETGESGIDIWTAGKEGELDLTTNVSRFGLGGLNNVAIIGDDTVVFGGFFNDVESVVNQVANPAASIIDQSNLAELLPTLTEDTVSVIATTGAFLDVWSLVLPERADEIEALFADSAEATGPFPRVNAAAFAITAGALGPSFTMTGEGTPDAAPLGTPEQERDQGGVIQARLDLDSEDEATTAVAAVEYRWNSWNTQFREEPYADLMTIVTAEPDPDVGNVAAIDFRAVSSNRIWLDLVLQRDLLPFAWASDSPPEATPTAAG